MRTNYVKLQAAVCLDCIIFTNVRSSTEYDKNVICKWIGHQTGQFTHFGEWLD